MSQQTKPTAGALRAAKQVMADLSDEEVPDADTVEMLEQAITKVERSEQGVNHER